MLSILSRMLDKPWLKFKLLIKFLQQDFNQLYVNFHFDLAFIDFQYDAVNGFDFNLRSGRIETSNFLGISIILLQDRRW